MNCDESRRSIPFILYSETSFEEEEAVHAHLDRCEACRVEFHREQALHRVLDGRELEVSPFFLRKSRDQLAAAIEAELTQARGLAGWREHWKTALGLTFILPGFARPLGAVALIALGFFAARFTPLASAVGIHAGMAGPSSARVRYVEPGPRGNVQLIVDETRQRVISGPLEDAHIRALLLSAAKDPSDPGLRVESVDILRTRMQSGDVRTALLYALQNDANSGVRLKALEGLKPYASQADVRKALSRVLLTDDNPGLRTQAIDLLTQSENQQHVVGVLQESMHNENNRYIRLQCEKALRGMKASLDTY